MQRTHVPAVVIAILAMTSCDADAPAKPVTDAAKTIEPAPTSKCAPDHAAELSRVLVAGCEMPILGEYARIETNKLARASWATKPRAAIDGVFVVLTARGLDKRGMPNAPWDARSEISELQARVQERRTKHAGWSPRFVAVIHSDVKLAAVQDLLEALAEASLTSGTLVLASSTLPPKPGPLHPDVYARHAAQLDAEPANRATRIAQGIEDDLGDCPELVKVFHDIATTDPNDRCKAMMPAVAKAIVACDCPAWEPSVVSWLQLAEEGTGAPQVHAEDVELLKHRAVQVDGTKTWGELVASRSAPIEALWLDVGVPTPPPP